MNPVLTDKAPKALNEWFDASGYPDNARNNLRTMQHIKSNLKDLYYMNDEQEQALDFWIDTLSLRHGKRIK